MTEKRKEKYETLIIKLAEIKYILTMLNMETDLIDGLLVECRERKELEQANKKNTKPNKTKSIPSVYTMTSEIEILFRNLDVYKKSETIKNKILNKLSEVNKTLESKPHWKLKIKDTVEGK